MPYKLHVYGGDNIEETVDKFSTKKEAMREAEGRSSGDTDDWRDEGDSMVLVDRNRSDEMKDLVINKATEV
jgi:hypothetical protein